MDQRNHLLQRSLEFVDPVIVLAGRHTPVDPSETCQGFTKTRSIVILNSLVAGLQCFLVFRLGFGRASFLNQAQSILASFSFPGAFSSHSEERAQASTNCCSSITVAASGGHRGLRLRPPSGAGLRKAVSNSGPTLSRTASWISLSRSFSCAAPHRHLRSGQAAPALLNHLLGLPQRWKDSLY